MLSLDIFKYIEWFSGLNLPKKNKTGHVCIKATLRRLHMLLQISSITYFESVSVTLVTEHAMSMSSIRLSSVACPALQYISKLSHKRHDFREKVFEYIMRV